MNTFFTYLFKHSYYKNVKNMECYIKGPLLEATKVWASQNNVMFPLDEENFNFLKLLYENRNSINVINNKLEQYKYLTNNYPLAVKFLLDRNQMKPDYEGLCSVLSYKGNFSDLNNALTIIAGLSSEYEKAWELYSNGIEVNKMTISDILKVLTIKETYFAIKELVLRKYFDNRKIISLICGDSHYDIKKFDEKTCNLETKVYNFFSLPVKFPKHIDKRILESENLLHKQLILDSKRYGNDIKFKDDFSIDDFFNFRKQLDRFGVTFDKVLNLVQNHRNLIKQYNLEHKGKSVVFIEDYYRILDEQNPLYDLVHLNEQERLKRVDLIDRATHIKDSYSLGFRIFFGNSNPELLSNEVLLDICNKSDEIIQKHQEEKKKEDERERLRIAQQLERERKRIEQQKKDKCKSLRMCIDSWTERIGDVPYFYLVKYFSIKDYGHVTDASIWQNRRLVWNFKNDPQKSVNPFAHDSARKEVVATLVCELQKRFKDKCSDLTLFCIPASTQLKTSRRYMQFAMEMHEKCGIISSFNQVKVIEDSVAKHDGGSGLQTVELDEAFFKDRYVIIFDDVVTSGSSMLRTKYRLEELGAFVIGCMSVGKTV